MSDISNKDNSNTVIEHSFFVLRKSGIFTTPGLTTIIIFSIILSLGAVKFYKAIPAFADLIVHPLNHPVGTEIKSFETGYNSNFETMQKSAVNLIGRTEKAFGKRVMETSIMTLAFDTKGNLHRIMPKTDITRNLNNLKTAMTHLKSKNIKNTFVLVPNSVIAGKTKLPLGITDYQNQTGDRVINELKVSNLFTVDLREEFLKNNVNPQEVFFNTDHHWKIPSAFLAAKITATYLNNTFKFGLDPDKIYSNYDNYEVSTYPKTYAGSYTVAAGESFVGPPDDFTTVLPKFNTSFRFRSFMPDGELQKTEAGETMDYTGPFSSALYDGGHQYSSYFRGGLTNLVVENHLATNNLKCFVVGTSHARAASTFLSLYFKKLVFVDMQDARFNQNLYEYIDKIKPDVVVIMYACYTFTMSNPFNFDQKTGTGS